MHVSNAGPVECKIGLSETSAALLKWTSAPLKTLAGPVECKIGLAETRAALLKASLALLKARVALLESSARAF